MPGEETESSRLAMTSKGLRGACGSATENPVKCREVIHALIFQGRFE